MIENWVLTYAVHSTLLLGAAWVLSRVMPNHWHAGRDAVWKAALGTALVSASVASWSPGPFSVQGPTTPTGVVTTVGPLALTVPRTFEADAQAPSLRFDQAAPGRGSVAAPARIDESVRRAGVTPTPDRAFVETSSQVRGPELGRYADEDRLTLRAGAPWSVAAPAWLRGLALVVLGLGSAFGLLKSIRSLVRLRRGLGHRRPLTTGLLREELDRLQSEIGLHGSIVLTDAPGAPAPMAIGLREICVPAQALEGLSPRERQAALAHELAHLVRHDPLWFTALHLLESVFFFLPLHRVARRQIQAEAEFLCDDWATRRTGSRLDLARCLAKVADWGGTPAPASAASMAGVSPLVARVRRLLEPERTTPRGSGSISVIGVVLVATLLLLFGPRFTEVGEAAVAGPDGSPRVAPRAHPVAPPTYPVAIPAAAAAPAALALPAAAATPAAVARVAPVPVPESLWGVGDRKVWTVPAPAALRGTGNQVWTIPPSGLDETIFLLEHQLHEANEAGLRDMEDGRMTIRVESEEGTVVARIEQREIHDIVLDGEEIPAEQYDFDGETLTIWDEAHEEKLFVTRLPIDRVRIDRLRGVRGPVVDLSSDRLPKLHNRLWELQRQYEAMRSDRWQMDADAALDFERLESAEARRLEMEAQRLRNLHILRPLTEERAARREYLDQLSAEVRAQTLEGLTGEERARELQRMATELREQKQSLERHLEQLEHQLQMLEETDDAPDGSDRYWDGPYEWDDEPFYPGTEEGNSLSGEPDVGLAPVPLFEGSGGDGTVSGLPFRDHRDLW